MSIGVFQFHIVVRQKGNHFASGVASEMPLNNGWKDVEGGDFGYWYGSQASYRPCQWAFQKAGELVEKLNRGEQ